MRIDGKRASKYTDREIAKMLRSDATLSGEVLTEEQFYELRKTRKFRKMKEAKK